jgi:predicted O-linked N-acetylglucosamine transferase (SPINDLY family)
LCRRAINLGLLYEVNGQPEKALATWKRAIQPDEARITLEIQQGRLLEKLGRFEEAESVLRRALMTDPVQPDVVHHWVHLRQKTCQWPVALSDIPGLSAEELIQSSGPFGIMALTDDIDLQREAAATWIARKTEPAPRRLAPVKLYPHERIRIGYMSSDFCSHAMSYLITNCSSATTAVASRCLDIAPARMTAPNCESGLSLPLTIAASSALSPMKRQRR